MNIKPIKESDFKYTENKHRKEWIKHIYPFGEYLIPLFTNIPWDSYNYNGNFRAWYDDDGEITYKDTNITTKSSKPYFYFFGGTSYELLNTVYSCVDLHKYVDPTGDIDMSLILPHIEIDSDTDYLNYLFTEKEKSEESLSPFLDDYTKWLFEEVVKQFENMPKRYFDEMFDECENLEIKEKAHFVKLVHKKICIKRLFLFEENMIKIQGLCKFKNIDEDHFFEFVLPLSNLDDIDFLNNKEKKLLKITDSIYINDFNYLFLNDMKAIQTRIHALNNSNSSLEYKFYNHLKRFEYLLQFIIDCVFKENKLNFTNKEITNITTFSLKIFVFFYLLKLSNYKLKIFSKSERELKQYYKLLKERKELKENQSALSIEGRTFKKSQINELEVNSKKRTNSKEPFVLYRDIYKELFPSEGGRYTRKKLHNSR